MDVEVQVLLSVRNTFSGIVGHKQKQMTENPKHYKQEYEKLKDHNSGSNHWTPAP